MIERQTPKKNRAFPDLEADVAPITIAKNRSLEPFVYAFVATPENITQKPLGTLIGLFSVSVHKEDSAYIVNHLAATAKREYFLNPRRGAIESFETMLKRLNLTLAETVKNGQISWVGALHGAVAVIEKQNIHFTVTGKATVLLHRDNRFLDISDGLAAPDAAHHPLKTFMEISSGRLSDGDCLLFSSPEVFEIFTFAELERNARRLVPERRFARFIETALINELRIGSAIVVNISEKQEKISPAKTEKPKLVGQRIPKKNYFSAKTFEEPKKRKAAEISEEMPPETKSGEERIAKQKLFGDIYVQGESLPEESRKHPALISLQWKFEDIRARFRRTVDSAGTSALDAISAFGLMIRDAIRFPFSVAQRSLRRRFRAHPLQSKPVEKTPRESRKKFLSLPTIHIPFLRLLSISFPSVRSHIPNLSNIPVPRINQARIARGMETARAGWQTFSIFAAKISRIIGSGVKKFFALLKQFFFAVRRKFFALPQKTQIVVAMASTFGITLGAMALWNALDRSDELPVAVKEVSLAPTPTFPPANEREAALVSPKQTYNITGALLPLTLDGKLYVVTETGITDPESGASSVAPGRVVTASAMDDLDAIFVFTESRELYIFSPVNKRYIKNDIPLPGDLTLHNIGSFLTYIYLLDTDGKQVLRFPRAEGGFGKEKLLLTAPVSLDRVTGGSVSENIYLHSDTDVLSFRRGRPDPAFSFEKPATQLHITALCAHPDAPDSFAILDAPAKRIIVYSKNGAIQKQLFNEELSAADACSLSNDGASIAVSLRENVLVFLKENL